MRTTLDIDEDVLAAAKELARHEGETAGRVLSRLARQALQQRPVCKVVRGPKARYGIEPLPSRGGIVTNELIDRLRDEEGV
jgi:hypothetical protein